MLVRVHAVKPLVWVERDTRLTDHSSPRENSYPGKSRIEKRETIKAGQKQPRIRTACVASEAISETALKSRVRPKHEAKLRCTTQAHGSDRGTRSGCARPGFTPCLNPQLRRWRTFKPTAHHEAVSCLALQRGFMVAGLEAYAH